MNFWNPFFRKQEPVEIRSYTDALTNAYIAQALDGTEPGGIAALEVAAGLYSRAFASAVVEPQNAYTRNLTPDVLGLMGRSLVRRGESLHYLNVEDGQVVLHPVGSWNVFGTFEEKGWTYRLTFNGPSETETKWVQGDSVLHPRYGTHPERPWAGVSPLHFAGVTAKLAANLEQRLSEEAGGPVGHLLPVPSSTTGKANSKLAGLQKDLDALRGQNVLIESTAGNWSEGKNNAPRGDWEARRLGAAFPMPNVSLHDQVYRHVLSACGIPVELGISGGSGQGSREAYRRFIFSSVMPLSKIVEGELSKKLGVTVTLSFKDLQAHDLSGRATSYKKLIESGMSPADAMAVVSLEELYNNGE